MDGERSDATGPRSIPRRTLTWSIPVIATVAPVPAFAASPCNDPCPVRTPFSNGQWARVNDSSTRLKNDTSTVTVDQARSVYRASADNSDTVLIGNRQTFYEVQTTFPVCANRRYTFAFEARAGSTNQAIQFFQLLYNTAVLVSLETQNSGDPAYTPVSTTYAPFTGTFAPATTSASGKLRFRFGLNPTALIAGTNDDVYVTAPTIACA